MVSNQELKERLYEKRTGSDTKEYLVCDTCKGSYELQPGEKPGDFSSECECGGKLTYNRDISSSDKDKRRNRIILGAAIIVVFMVFVFPVLAIEYMLITETYAPTNKTFGTVRGYDQSSNNNIIQFNNLTIKFTSLEKKDTSLESKVQNSNNANLKKAYSNSQLQLRQSNAAILDLSNAIDTRQSQVEIQNKVTAAQSQLNIAQDSVNNVTSMI